MADDKGEQRVVPFTRCFILELPNEVLQHIATILPRDIDMVNLGLSCKEACERILNSDAPTWRIRYGHKYDFPRQITSEELLLEYQTRAIVLPHKLDIKKDPLLQVQFWLETIQTMLSEALFVPLPAGAMSKTYEQIRKTVQSMNFLSQPTNGNPSEIFYAVQLSLTALALDPEVCTSCYRDDYKIENVYSFTQSHHTEPLRPFISHQCDNLAELLNMRSFWQRHLLNPTEGTFYDSFSRLSNDLKPKSRKTDGSGPMDLSKSWLGYYSCVHPFPFFTEDLKRRQSCADLDTHWDQVEIMTLEIESQSYVPFWPSECNEIIPLSQYYKVKPLFFAGYQNTYGGKNQVSNPVFGFAEPIEMDYGGIVGWTRVCFVICEKVEEGKDPAWGKGYSGWVHGYEAMLLPGGRIMLGRWLDMKNTSGRGPFIFWDV